MTHPLVYGFHRKQELNMDFDGYADWVEVKELIDEVMASQIPPKFLVGFTRHKRVAIL